MIFSLLMQELAVRNVGGGMRKLEEILNAEEAARHVLSDARDQAKVVIRDAEAAAAQIRVDERAVTAEQVASIEAQAVAQAREESAAFAAQAALELETQLATGRARVDDVVRLVVEDMAG